MGEGSCITCCETVTVASWKVYITYMYVVRVCVCVCVCVCVSEGGDSESQHARRSWRKSIMLVWRAAAQHKYANLFLHRVKDEDAPGYHDVIHR